MKFCGLLPFSSGVIPGSTDGDPQRVRSEIIQRELTLCSRYGVRAFLALTRQTALGFEWQLFAVDALSRLSGSVARSRHSYAYDEDYATTIYLLARQCGQPAIGLPIRYRVRQNVESDS
jgi:hypothetical protein